MAKNDRVYDINFPRFGGSYSMDVGFRYNADYTFTSTTQYVYTNLDAQYSQCRLALEGSYNHSFDKIDVRIMMTLPSGTETIIHEMVDINNYQDYQSKAYEFLINCGPRHYNLLASNVFTSNNSTSRTRTYTYRIASIRVYKMVYKPISTASSTWIWQSDGFEDLDFDHSSDQRIYPTLYAARGEHTYTYNIPPTFNATQLTISPSPAYRNVSTASTTVSAATAYCGGSITSSKLTIGSQTATGSGNGTLTTAKLNTVGTFTPSVTVTDSRGVSKTINLNNIAVKNVDIPPSFDYTALSFNHDYIYKDFTSASITVSNISVAFDGTVTNVKLLIGPQSASRADAGSLTIDLANSGSFKPQIQVSDSWGLTRSYDLSDLVVSAYFLPYINQTEINAQRCLSNGQIDDEGTYVNIALPIHYTKDVAYLTEPEFAVEDVPISLTWYEDAARQNPIDWTEYQPNSPCTIYALYSYPFEYQNNYTLYFVPTDIDYHDDAHDGEQVYAILPTAYYTVDFRAGGHGVAFGKFAKRDGFDCDMNAYFNNDVLFAVDFNDANDKLAQAIIALGWENKVKVT